MELFRLYAFNTPSDCVINPSSYYSYYKVTWAAAAPRLSSLLSALSIRPIRNSTMDTNYCNIFNFFLQNYSFCCTKLYGRSSPHFLSSRTLNILRKRGLTLFFLCSYERRVMHATDKAGLYFTLDIPYKTF